MPANNRILIVGIFSKGSLGASYASAFKDLGYDVSCFDYDEAYYRSGLLATYRPLRRVFRWALWSQMNRRTREVARSIRPALILALKAPYLDPETIRDMRSLGTPVVNYYPDNPYCGVPWDPRKTSAQRHDLLDTLREYTRLWIWEPSLAARLLRDKVCADYMPFASDPAMYHPNDHTTSVGCQECIGDHDIVLIGQHNAKREAHIEAIRNHSVDLWGARWTRAATKFKSKHRVHRVSVFGTQVAKLYSTAAVSLNVVDDLNMPGHNMRTFEIPASGGVMLSTYTKEQADFFPEDEAACYYRTKEELDPKIDRLLEDRPFRERIARNAMHIASQHTYRERAATMLQECGVGRSLEVVRGGTVVAASGRVIW